MNSTAASAASSVDVAELFATSTSHDAQEVAPVGCIVGPTAAGKSALAMALAEANGLAIVSADSRQVYRQFDIGTAKPTAAERARVAHFGIDVVEPTERYSAHRWAQEAARWSRTAVKQGTPPVIVGGTGLYIRAFVEPLAELPALDIARRTALEPVLAGLDRAELQRWCERLDPARAHLGRTQQLRAIETALLHGTRLSDHLARSSAPEGSSPPSGRPAHYLVVDPGPVLATRIADRVRAMVVNGFVEEIERLRLVIPPEAPAWKASGYGVMRAAVEGALPMATAIERVIIETRQYAKRQRTWFRHQLPPAFVTTVNPQEHDCVTRAQAWWDAVSRAQTA